MSHAPKTANATPRRLRFVLLSLLAGTALLAFAWAMSIVQHLSCDHEIAQYIEQHGGECKLHHGGPIGVRLLQKAFRSDRFLCVAGVFFGTATDADLEVVARLGNLQALEIGAAATPMALDAFAGCTELRSLHFLDSSQITLRDLVASAVGKRLVRLTLTGPAFDDQRIAGLDKLTGLEHLTLEQATATDHGLGQIRQLRSLWSLELKGCPNIHGAGLAGLEDHPRLFGFDAEGMTLDESAFAHLAKASNLTGVGLPGTKLTEAGLDYLSRCDRLEQLDLSDTNISDAGLKSISKLSRLRRLNLNHVHITGQGLAVLEALRQLGHLEIGPEPGVEAVTRLKQALPDCPIEYTSGGLSIRYIVAPAGR